MIGNRPDSGGLLSYSRDALLSTSYADDYAIRGNGFEIRKRFALTSLQTIYVCLDFTAAVGKRIITLPLILGSTNGLIFFDTYGIDSYENGNPVDILKLNSMSPISPLAVAKTGITPSGGPYGLREYKVGSESTPLYSGGGGNINPSIKIFPSGSILAGKVENKESDNNVFNLGLIFYEI